MVGATQRARFSPRRSVNGAVFGTDEVFDSSTTYASVAEHLDNGLHSGHRSWLAAIVACAAGVAIGLVVARVAVSFVTMD